MATHGGDEGIDRPIALAFDFDRLAGLLQVGMKMPDLRSVSIGHRAVVDELEHAVAVEIELGVAGLFDAVFIENRPMRS